MNCGFYKDSRGIKSNVKYPCLCCMKEGDCQYQINKELEYTLYFHCLHPDIVDASVVYTTLNNIE